MPSSVVTLAPATTVMLSQAATVLHSTPVASTAVIVWMLRSTVLSTKRLGVAEPAPMTRLPPSLSWMARQAPLLHAFEVIGDEGVGAVVQAEHRLARGAEELVAGERGDDVGALHAAQRPTAAAIIAGEMLCSKTTSTSPPMDTDEMVKVESRTVTRHASRFRR